MEQSLNIFRSLSAGGRLDINCIISLYFSCVSLNVFALLQLLLVDGLQLRSNPVSVMDGVQKFLGVAPYFNYTQALL